MTALFIPGSAHAGSDPEEVYAGIRKTALAGSDHSAQPVRIFKLSFRHEGADLEAEVGQPDPVDGAHGTRHPRPRATFAIPDPLRRGF